MSSRSALIVGAGIGGLAAALALRRTGWQVRIFERAETARELGFALMLAPNAILSLRSLGIADEVIAGGAVIRAAEVRRPDGRVLRRLGLTQEAGPSALRAVATLRPALHGALLDAVGPDLIETESEAIGFDSSPQGVELRLAGGRRATGDLLVGADGVGSAIRKELHAGEGPPRPSGYFALRGVAYDAAHHLGMLDGISYLGPGIEAGIARASATDVYWYLSLLAEDVQARDARLVLGLCSQRFDPQFKAITGATAPQDLRLDELFERTRLDSWGRGRVTLLGDAAHPMLPHAGQGAAQALEDAVELGLALRATEPAEDALRHYERVRSPRAQKIVTLARRIAGVTTTRNPLIAGLRDLGIQVLPQRLLVNAFVQEERRAATH